MNLTDAQAAEQRRIAAERGLLGLTIDEAKAVVDPRGQQCEAPQLHR